MNQIICGDSAIELKKFPENYFDLIISDPPYGYSFMNKDWDKAIIGVDTWRECLRVLKPGAWAYVMSAPRQDVLSHMIVNLSDAGFKTDFTSMYWAYATGFPKSANIGKMVDKKLGKEREIITVDKSIRRKDHISDNIYSKHCGQRGEITKPTSEQAKKLDGSYAGFQPKPAVEVILVCMKPLDEKNYVEQAMKNGKGITWLDDCRIPSDNNEHFRNTVKNTETGNDHNWKKGSGFHKEFEPTNSSQGRFPANLLVSDDALNDGNVTKSKAVIIKNNNTKSILEKGFEGKPKDIFSSIQDSGSFSRYFDLDKWDAQFIITPKASKSEKNKGLDNFTEKLGGGMNATRDKSMKTGSGKERINMMKNTHPTVKPISLMSYLITMGSREGDIILDPFAGSGTTLIAATLLKRNSIGIEIDPHYCSIMKNRLDYWKNKSFEKIQKIKKQAKKKKIESLETFLKTTPGQKHQQQRKLKNE